MGILNKRIKELRQNRGLTLLQVANMLGVKEATVQRYESGEIKNIKHDTIADLANIFDCSPAYLMGWSDNQYSPEYEKTLQEKVPDNIRNNLIFLRNKRNLSPEEVANKFNLELDDYLSFEDPSFTIAYAPILNKIANFYCVDVDDLMNKRLEYEPITVVFDNDAERELVNAYRQADPRIQNAVCALLELPAPNEELERKNA